MIKRGIHLILFVLMAFSASGLQAQEVQWISFEEAAELVADGNSDKKIFIDVYTDWCGWCKKMDKDTFQNPEVAAYMKENYHMVKFNAEQKESITFRGKEYKFIPSGRRGYHELAVALLNGRLSYPTVVFLDEQMNPLYPLSGYQKPEPFLKVARYFGDNQHLENK